MPETVLASAPTLAASATPSAPARSTVLIVEDDKMVAVLFAHLLGREGLRCVCADDGASALRWFEKNSGEAALVVMDCGLPDASGGLLALRLRELAPGLPVLLTSGTVPVEVERVLAAGGRTDFLAKPFRHGELFERACRLVSGLVAK